MSTTLFPYTTLFRSHVRKEARRRGRGSGVDVLDEVGASGSAIASPQLGSRGSVVGREEQRTTNGVHAARIGPRNTRPDVLDQNRCVARAIEFPQFVTDAALGCRRKKRPARRGESARGQGLNKFEAGEQA